VALSILVQNQGVSEESGRNPRERSGSVRVVHFADVHVQPERNAPAQLAKALKKMQSLAPHAVLLGGDVVMNTVGVGFERAMQQWNLWHQACAGLDMPIYSCIGNQDCWGWNKKASGCSGSEPLFGKAMALHQLGLENSYYAVELGAWRLIVLDSVQQGGRHGYVAGLDSPQHAWLENELEHSGERPILVMSHVPIVAGPADLFSSHITEPNQAGAWPLPSQHLHRDSHGLIQLFRRYPQVKLCLAGHIHAAQRMEFAGISFIGSPAVSGEWWRGDFLGCPSGFTIVDLHPDGRFESAFCDY
jgi:Icc protein